jgi:hypothetical protein
VSLSIFSQINPFLGIIDVDSCKFETPCILVNIDTSAQNIWQIGEPQKPFFNEAYSIPNALITDTLNSYPTQNHSFFDLKFCVYDYYIFGIIVGFKHKYQTDTLSDGGYIDVSYDNGQTWVNVLYDDTVHNLMEFNTENLYSEQDTLLGGINGFSGTSNEWIYTRIQWIWEYPCDIWAPDSLTLRFHFISDSNQTNKDGWMIDNILISFADEGSAIQNFNSLNTRIEISPNPVDNFATISFNTQVEGPLTFVLINSIGKIVKRINGIATNQFYFHRENLPCGVYLMQLQKEDSIIGTRKIILK